MAQVKHILEKMYDDDYVPTPEEEAVLEKLEQEWLAMCRANELESYDFWETSGRIQ